MIQKLVIKNFLCHENLSLDLSPGVNVFVGSSGKGKSSSAIRPLWWVTKNRPMGEGYRTWGSKETRVEVLVNDQEGNPTWVVRGKSNAENYYEVNGDRLVGFDKKVPERVEEILNLSDINFQHQHDGIFLLSMSPANVGKLLNEITGMDGIDKAFSHIRTRLWNERDQLKNQTALLDGYEENLLKYVDLAKLEEKLPELKGNEDQISQNRKKALCLRDTAIQLTRIGDSIAGLRKVGDLASKWGKISDLSLTISPIRAKAEKLKQISDKWVKLHLERTRIEQPLTKFQDKVTQLKTLMDSELNARRTALDLKAILGQLDLIKTYQTQTESTLKKQEEEFNQRMPARCPLCGSDTQRSLS